MNKFLKALSISIILFICHVILLFTYGLIKGDNSTNILSAAIYLFVFAFWAYYVLVLIYSFISASVKNRKYKILTALILVLIGYFLSRWGDIVDGDFKRNFSIISFLSFLFSVFLIVGLDQLLTKEFLLKVKIDVP